MNIHVIRTATVTVALFAAAPLLAQETTVVADDGFDWGWLGLLGLIGLAGLKGRDRKDTHTSTPRH